VVTGNTGRKLAIDNPVLFLVGTKKDLLSNGASEFVYSEAAKIANRLEAEFWTVSAQSGENVCELFSRIASLSFNTIICQELKSKRESMNSNPNSSPKYAENFIKLSKTKERQKEKGFLPSINCVIK